MGKMFTLRDVHFTGSKDVHFTGPKDVHILGLKDVLKRRVSEENMHVLKRSFLDVQKPSFPYEFWTSKLQAQPGQTAVYILRAGVYQTHLKTQIAS